MPTTPPPYPNGHQPVDGEGITRFTVRAGRSADYQNEAVELEYVFPRPVSYSEALPAIDSVAQSADEEAQARLEARLAANDGVKQGQVAAARAALTEHPASQDTTAPSEPAPFKAPPATAQQVGQTIQREIPQAQQVPASNGEPNFLWADKPNGKGSVRYLPKSVLSTMDMVDAAKKQIEKQGLPESEVHIFDNRERLATKGAYSAGSIKPKNDGFLQQTLGDVFLGDVEFNDDGSVKVYLNKNGQQAQTAIKVARQAQGATPGL